VKQIKEATRGLGAMAVIDFVGIDVSLPSALDKAQPCTNL
jgi:threonine dehydrogenase-like Zn-dependent dehydrogenase